VHGLALGNICLFRLINGVGGGGVMHGRGFESFTLWGVNGGVVNVVCVRIFHLWGSMVV
jgi:hypothetical protein